MKEEIKERLIRHLNFLEGELKDYALFKDLNKDLYIRERSKRRMWRDG
jgi:hypothetical protein